jgi:hypothetical protein
MYNRHIIRAEYLKPPCQLFFGIFEVERRKTRIEGNYRRVNNSEVNVGLI